jgi:hypothetical protein
VRAKPASPTDQAHLLRSMLQICIRNLRSA